mgnify:FL=1
MELYTVVNDAVDMRAIKTRNHSKSWKYGYDAKYDIVVISKDGTIGEIYDINGLKIALPHPPLDVITKNKRWEPELYPKDLSRIKTIFDWNKRDNAFKDQWVEYIEGEFDKRELGHWFINRDKKTYITGSHYMYLQWTKIDVGHPEFRESNRIKGHTVCAT